jgi:hypothetical protein
MKPDLILHPDIKTMLCRVIGEINLAIPCRPEEGECEMLEHDKELIEALLEEPSSG